jgi:hypothetical protein
MKKILSPNDYNNCPICGQICIEESCRGYNVGYRDALNVKVFFCFNPTETDPLHFYTHIIDKDFPDEIAFQEFSLDLGNKHVLFSNNYKTQTSCVKNNKHGTPLEFPIMIFPDFPSLKILKNKTKTILTFS